VQPVSEDEDEDEELLEKMKSYWRESSGGL